MAGIVLEEYELLGDVRYRSYVSAIDKALKSFEYTSEWPDLISALGKLNKVLLSHTKFQVIPRRITISKRLAQCMHPALPGGVHLKALETYDIIFKCIGSSRLSQELFIYSAGLFPLLANAAMNVKPSLLTIYETHFIPLGEKLRPGLNGLLIGVLPGLDEGSDYYERTDILLQKICEGVEKRYFYGCMWKCILSNPVIRLPAISFITNHFSRKQSTEDQLYIIGTDIDSMVHGLCSSLQDSSVLVQRCALDLLLLGFPIHNNQLVAADMVHIVTAAVTVVLRRDMSLNRRLFSWLLGGDTLNSKESKNEPATNVECNLACSYFHTYSKDLLLEALQLCIDNPLATIPSTSASSGSPDLLCFRLLISLLDRPEISSIILDDILIEVFRSLYLRCYTHYSTPSYSRSPVSLSKKCAELIKTANLFFATLEPWYLWAYSAKLFRKACEKQQVASSKENQDSETFVPKVGSGQPVIAEMCILLGFLLDVVSLETYLEARSEHLPDLMCEIGDALSENCESLSPVDMSLALQLCSKILSKVQAPMINMDEIEQRKKSLYAVKSKPVLPPMKNVSDSCSKSEDSIEGSDAKCDIQIAGILSNSNCASDFGQNIPATLGTSITNCMAKYEKLLVSFLKVKVLSDPEKTISRFESLLLPKRSSKGQREEKLDKILHTSLKANCNCLSESEVNIFTRDIQQSAELKEPFRLEEEVVPKDEALTKAFKGLCHIIVELSSFPIYCTNSKKIFENNYTKLDLVELPEWLKLLTSVACFGDFEDVVFTAMTTVFDLISLTQAVSTDCEHSHILPHSPVEQTTASQTVVSVVPIPIMTSAQLFFLSEETSLYKVAAAKLWKYVDDPQAHVSLRGSELLQKVHNLSLASSVCESVICDALSSGSETEQLYAQKKFCILWHLTRDLSIKLTPPASVKAFDQCFFRMLDNLAKETGPSKAISQAWLNHSLQRGDISRFMEPILMILLHPDSARVSIQHVNVHSPKKVTISDEGRSQNSEECEAKIYAISSISGNVIYHVSDESRPSSLHVSPQKKILALTSVVNVDGNKVSEVVTEKSVFKEFDIPSSHERDLRLPISLFINPFGSLSSLCSDSQLDTVSNTPDVSQATRIPQKYSFDQDDEDVGEEEDSVKSLTESLGSNSENVIAAMVDEILDCVVRSVAEGANEMHSSSGEYSITGDYNFENSSTSHNNTVAQNAAASLKQNTFSEVTVHPIHSYMLLYCQVYDSKKTLYALYSLKSIILANPRITLCSMATTNISNSLSFRGQQLQFLLARHRKSVFGNNFHGELSAEGTTMYRSSTFVETVILSCLYHIRSYYPNLPMMRLTLEEVLGNREVRLLCMEVLSLVFSELVAIVKDSGKNFASYLNDLLLRSKVQKTLLHCIVACVYDSQNNLDVEKKVSFTEVIVEFNDKDVSLNSQQRSMANDFQDTFQIHLLHLIATLIVIEDTVAGKTMTDKEPRGGVASKSFEFTFDRSSHASHHSQVASTKYQQGLPIPAQPMFLNAVLTALDYQHNRHMHIHWLSFVTSALPFAGRWLSRLVMTVIIQLCFNLEIIASTFKKQDKESDSCCPNGMFMPPDYLITIIEGLTTLCHYCLLECPPITNLFNPSLLQPLPSQSYVPGTSTSQIISNLIHVFSASSNEKENSTNSEPSVSVDPILSARRALLSNLPRIISSLTSIYQITTEHEKSASETWVIGTPKVVKQHILSFLSPISLNYGANFIAALAVIWNDQRLKAPTQNRKVIPAWSPEQVLLVDLLAAIKVLPIESIVQTVRNVLKQPPPVSQKHKVHLEVCTLQLFLAYIQNTSDSHLVESWQSLLCLWRDGLQISSPPVQFHLLAILHEFVQRAPILEDKKSQKELQDITHKLIEACSSVASASLEQTTWLWRNLAVRPGPQTDLLAPVADSGESETKEDAAVEETAEVKPAAPETTVPNDDAQYSVQALTVLAEFLAPVLDFVYIGEEKDKVVPLLSNIMYYVTPYLKNHSSHNAPSFRACCQLLSSISGYQHTRKAWRKDAFDLLLDNSFFQMSSHCLVYWRSIVDHLMTHDKTTFRDFMARVSVAQAGSLNLFSSKEQEYEQRAHLLKRLAFVLFCSEIDQYQKYMPDIQERLTECLRLHHVPSVHAEVFLCFRVLLIRMSAFHVTSLWPVIITEMVQVFTQIEYELCTDSEEFSSGGGLKKVNSSHLRRLSTLESSWVMNTMNGLNAHNNPAWLHLYLSVCKLLDMAVSLPANILPQFQMYRWAFVGDSPPLSSENNNVKDNTKPYSHEFVPHVTRLAKLLNRKDSYKSSVTFVPGQLLLTSPSIQTIQQLQPFFNALSNITCKRTLHTNVFHSLSVQNSVRKQSLSKCCSAPELQSLATPQDSFFPHTYRTKSILEQIEIVLQNDFIESLVN